MEIFNLGTGYSVLEVVKAFEQTKGIEIPYQIVDRRCGDAAESYADVSKARNLLNWEAKKDLEQMCWGAWC